MGANAFYRHAIVHPIYIERGILPVPAVDNGAKTL